MLCNPLDIVLEIQIQISPGESNAYHSLRFSELNGSPNRGQTNKPSVNKQENI